ncbi:conserved hypothetical protein [Aliarcobacter butzleri JV22]|nr:conserved hypothetical protein [Aliarcobacter butzleri JV22]
MKGLSKNKEMEDIVPYNIKMFPIIRYFNVITYPLFFYSQPLYKLCDRITQSINKGYLCNI